MLDFGLNRRVFESSIASPLIFKFVEDMITFVLFEFWALVTVKSDGLVETEVSF